eukprot:3765907-Amphidinium_carterae.1
MEHMRRKGATAWHYGTTRNCVRNSRTNVGKSVGAKAPESTFGHLYPSPQPPNSGRNMMCEASHKVETTKCPKKTQTTVLAAAFTKSIQ